MKLRDFKGLSQSAELTVESVTSHGRGYYTVKLTGENLKWRPGEHGIFTLPHREFSGRKWRAFSVASIPKEGYILIGTTVGNPPSGFKQVLTALEKGDKVKIRGPFGWFTLRDDKSPIVLIAGGIGITPIRSLILSIDPMSDREVHLVHSARGGHLFSDTIKKIAKQNKNIDVHFTEDREVTRKMIEDFAMVCGNNAYYYLSGPIKMISEYRKVLKSKSVKRNRMINDPFLGY